MDLVEVIEQLRLGELAVHVAVQERELLRIEAAHLGVAQRETALGADVGGVELVEQLLAEVRRQRRPAVVDMYFDRGVTLAEADGKARGRTALTGLQCPHPVGC